MSENTQTQEELVNNFIKQESDRAIALIRMNNLEGNTLTFLNQEQKNIFVTLIKEFYLKKLNSVNVQNNDLELIFYNHFIQKFSVPISEELTNGTKIRHYISLSFEQFITAIIHALIIGIFKLDNVNQFRTTYSDNTSILTNDADELQLKKFYPYVTGKIYLEMISDPSFASKIKYLSDIVATEGLEINPDFLEIYQKNTAESSQTKDLRRGGKNKRKTNRKTNRKRKYKCRSNSKSNSNSSFNSKRHQYKYRTSKRSRK